MPASQQLEDLVSSTVTIPTIPRTLLEINSVIADPDGSAAEAAEIVAQDPAIASKCLRLANSSVYALKSPVSDIQHAVCLLGLKILRNLVVQATVLDQFSSKGDPRFSQWLWDHSLKAAHAARGIIRFSPIDFGLDPEEAYTAGLLHDIGKVLLMTALPDRFTTITKESLEHDRPLDELEQAALGFTHADAGALLAQQWNMGETLCRAIELHHSDAPTDDEEAWSISALIRLANGMAHLASEDDPVYFSNSVLYADDVKDLLQISPDAYESLLEDVREATFAM